MFKKLTLWLSQAYTAQREPAFCVGLSVTSTSCDITRSCCKDAFHGRILILNKIFKMLVHLPILEMLHVVFFVEFFN